MTNRLAIMLETHGVVCCVENQSLCVMWTNCNAVLARGLLENLYKRGRI